MGIFADVFIIFGVFLTLLLIGVWIPLAIGLSGLVFLAISSGLGAFQGLGLSIWGGVSSFTLTAIPLFILMAEILLNSGLSLRVYRGLSHLVRHLPGGLLQTNIVGCAIFSAISGSSVATAASIGTVAIPELTKRNYDRHLSVGTIAAGGTLGILIPPSIAMIIYGSFTNLSIAKLFMAGVIPGLLLVLLFMIFVGFYSIWKPSVAPKGNSEDNEPPASVSQIFNDLMPFAVLIIIVLGSLYLGFATPTESAALGCTFSAIIARVWGNLDLKSVYNIFQRTVRVSGAILSIIFAAYIFSYSIALSGAGQDIAVVIGGLDLNRWQFILLLFVFYTILGCLVDSISMIVITVPVLAPILAFYGFDGVWFGVILVLLIEIGQITPPMGLNLFVVQGIWDGRLEEVVRGVIPFYFLMVLMIAIVTLVPSVALWLPEQMIGR